MAIFSGRTGRRRRVLNEEVLSASSSHVALRAVGEASSSHEDAPRYGESASIENHPQITDFVPRRFGTLAMIVVLGLASTAALEVMHAYAGRVAAVVGPWAAASIDLTASGSLATWLSAALLLVSSVTCLLIYSLRRHKIADYRGRYRIWLAASAACLMLSVDSVAALHRLLAAAAVHYTLWTALREHAVWWLALGGIPLGWIVLRVLVDVSESRLATSALVLSVAAYLTALAGFLGGLPIVSVEIEPMATVGATLAGHWLLLLAVVCYARFVVLDAQGLIPVRIPRRRTKSDQSGRRLQTARDMLDSGRRSTRVPGDGRPQDDEDELSTLVDAKTFRRQQKQGSARRSASATSKPTQWIDGSEPGSADDDDSQPRPRKLSKSERKRLRKLKARGRAA